MGEGVVASPEKESTQSKHAPQKKSPKMPTDVQETKTSASPSLQLTGAVFSKMNSSVWKNRQAGLEEVMQIIVTNEESVKANMSDLIASLRARLYDSNKNLVILALGVVAKLAQVMGAQWERSCKALIMDILKMLCDNKKSVREAAMNAVEACIVDVPLKNLLPYFLLFVTESKTNVDGRVSMMVLLRKALDKHSKQMEMGLAEVLTINADCLMDKAVEVRDVASSLVKELSSVLGINKIKECTESLSNTQAGGISNALTKLGLVATTTKKEFRPRSASLKSPQVTSSRPQTAGSKPSKQRRMSKIDASSPFDDHENFLFQFSDSKNERSKKGPKKLVVKFDEQKVENVEQVKALLSRSVPSKLMEYLFHTDFKYQCEAVDVIFKLLNSNDTNQFTNIISNMDLIFQWMCVGICGGNMQLLLKILDLLGCFLVLMKERDYVPTDYEMGIIFPCLVEKSGHNQDRIRQTYRELMKNLCQIYGVRQSSPLILQGLNLKNFRTRSVCLDVIELLIKENGSEACTPRIVKEVALLVGERDSTLRNAALNLIIKIFHIVGDEVFKGLSHVPDQARSIIDSKIKSIEQKMLYEKEEGERHVVERPKTPRRASAATPTPHTAHTPVANYSRSSDASPKTGEVVVLRGGQPSPARMQARSAAADAWNQSTILALSDNNVNCIEGMKQLCHILLDFGKNSSSLEISVLVNSADKLVYGLSEKVRQIFKTAIDEMQNSITQSALPGSSRGCKYVLNTLMHCFQQTSMAASVSEPTHRRIMKSLLLLLLNESIPKLEEGSQLLKALNVLMLKMLENGNRTSTFLALVWLLGEGANDVPLQQNSKFTDLVIKCLIKQTKHFNSSIESINLEGVMASIHSFLCSLDTGSVRNRLLEDEKPLRMVKTILHELCKMKGSDIYKYLQNIPRDPAKKQLIYTYIDLYVQTTSSISRPSEHRDENQSAHSGVPSRVPSSTDCKMELAAIFRNIGEKANAKQGLEDLYQFTIKYPEVDIQIHLSRTSDSFQEFIKDGLRKIAENVQKTPTKSKPLIENNTKAAQSKTSTLPSIEQLKQRIERTKALLRNNSTNGNMH